MADYSNQKSVIRNLNILYQNIPKSPKTKLPRAKIEAVKLYFIIF